jgi:hypothetical protein
MRQIIAAILFAALGGASPMQAAERHAMNHAGQHEMQGPGAGLVEPGQGAFGAIAEIVALLEADPETDWRRVDIEALRAHLIDMNALTLGAMAETVMQDDRVVFRVTGEGAALRAIRAMVPAHAAALSEAGNWRAAAIETERGVELTVAPRDRRELAKIAALGFIGVMATGAHHQAHHLAIAMGR